MRASDRGEVVEAHLDADGAPAAPVRGEARAQLARHPGQLGAQLRGVVDVAVEGALARLRDDLARGADLAVVLEARAAAQLAPEVRTETVDQHRLGRGGERGERGEPELAPAARRSSGRCPVRGRAARRRSARTPARVVSTTKPAGFSASEATFATSLLGPSPTEHLARSPRRSRPPAGASRRAASSSSLTSR